MSTDSIRVGVTRVAENLLQRSGEISASALVEAARPKNSAAHDGFEWDDQKAGGEYRLSQARQWLRIIRITVDGGEDRLVHIPQVTIEGGSSSAREGSYKPLSVVVGRQDEFVLAMDEALSRLGGARDAVVELRDAADAKFKGKKKRAMVLSLNKATEDIDSAGQRIAAVAR